MFWDMPLWGEHREQVRGRNPGLGLSPCLVVALTRQVLMAGRLTSVPTLPDPQKHRQEDIKSETGPWPKGGSPQPSVHLES